MNILMFVDKQKYNVCMLKYSMSSILCIIYYSLAVQLQFSSGTARWTSTFHQLSTRSVWLPSSNCLSLDSLSLFQPTSLEKYRLATKAPQVGISLLLNSLFSSMKGYKTADGGTFKRKERWQSVARVPVVYILVRGKRLNAGYPNPLFPFNSTTVFKRLLLSVGFHFTLTSEINVQTTAGP